MIDNTDDDEHMILILFIYPKYLPHRMHFVYKTALFDREHKGEVKCVMLIYVLDITLEAITKCHTNIVFFLCFASEEW